MLTIHDSYMTCSICHDQFQIYMSGLYAMDSGNEEVFVDSRATDSGFHK